jgi:uncharacterized membrane protein YidH (DUF202 family)
MRRTALAFLLLGQSLDALTFVLFFRVVPPGFALTERNPFTVLLMLGGGVAAVAAAKVGIAAFLYWRGMRPSVAHLSPYYLAFRNIALSVAMLSGFVGATFNTYAIAQVLRLA